MHSKTLRRNLSQSGRRIGNFLLTLKERWSLLPSLLRPLLFTTLILLLIVVDTIVRSLASSRVRRTTKGLLSIAPLAKGPSFDQS
jgi:hypothetical protein